jgi:4'-phosphopantetheinyl transferase
VAHVAVRRLLGERLALAPGAVVITPQPCHGCGGPHGRPSVPGDATHFSLSHSGDLVAVALADVPVGVDVEVIPDARTVDDVSPLLHPAETAELQALAPDDRSPAFGRCWTRKEAYLKALGAGLTQDPALTYVGTGPTAVSPPGWQTSDHPAPTGYTAAFSLRTDA